MIITISGLPGSGKDTIAKIASEKLGMELICVGNLRREMAKKRGLTLAEFNKLGEREDFTDIEVDNHTKELGKTKENFILIGRTAFHFIPQSIKVFLKVDLKEGARRIFEDKREGESFDSVRDVLTSIQRRMESDNFRYKKYYDLDVHNESQYDIVINSTNKSIEQVVEEFLERVKEIN